MGLCIKHSYDWAHEDGKKVVTFLKVDKDQLSLPKEINIHVEHTN